MSSFPLNLLSKQNDAGILNLAQKRKPTFDNVTLYKLWSPQKLISNRIYSFSSVHSYPLHWGNVELIFDQKTVTRLRNFHVNQHTRLRKHRLKSITIQKSSHW